MLLPAAAKNLVEKKLDAFIAKRMPPRVADKLRLSYTFHGNSVTIWENRAPWTPTMKEWTKSAVAQLRYTPKAQTWMLFGVTGTADGTGTKDWLRSRTSIESSRNLTVIQREYTGDKKRSSRTTITGPSGLNCCEPDF